MDNAEDSDDFQDAHDEDQAQHAAGGEHEGAEAAAVPLNEDLPQTSEDEGTDEWTEASTEAGPSAAEPAMDDSLKARREFGAGAHGCKHYRRRCKIVAPCCGEAFWCRHCHNAEKSDNQQDPQHRHELDRRAVAEVVCAICEERQPVSRACINCAVAFARYSCMICNFYDDDVEKDQFHCEECGICRVGGRTNYFHCSTCNCCYAEALRHSHVCIKNSMHANCPCCYEYLFDSIRAINVMACGHTIHNECLTALADQRTLTCPTCAKSYAQAGHLQHKWQEMDQALAATPMPVALADARVNILCHDCGTRSLVPFHVLGHKCRSCGAYNTSRVAA